MRPFRLKPPLGSSVNRELAARLGYVAFWPFQEGAGVRANDVIGGNTGTLTNFAMTGSTSNWVGGAFGKCPSFDGVDDYVALASQISNADTNNFSVSLWYRGTDTDQNSDFGKVLAGRNNSDIYVNLVLRSGYVEYLHYNAGWMHNIKSTTLVADGEWHHIAYVNHSDETGDLYIDGVCEVSGLSSSIGNDTYPFRIDGFMLGYLGVYTVGQLDAASIHNRDLSAAEIRWIIANPFAVVERR